MIILFGGSFDPPHMGHQQSVAAAAARFPHAKIWIMPGVQPAGAGGQHKQPTATFSQRVQMCELAFITDDLKERALVSTIEADIPPPNYTFKTLEKIRALNPDEDLCLLMGQDQIQQFPNWRNPKQILEMATILVVKRTTQKTSEQDLVAATNSTAEHLSDQVIWENDHQAAQLLDLQSRIELINVSLSLAESSLIRKFYQNGQQAPEGWLDPKVATYIEQHRIYH